jgi:hypothetical protein
MLPLAAAGDPLPDPVCSELYHGQRVRHHYTSSVVEEENDGSTLVSENGEVLPSSK